MSICIKGFDIPQDGIVRVIMIESDGGVRFYGGSSVIARAVQLPPHGRLLVLPCKVGDTVFYNDTYGNVYEAIVQSIVIDKSRTIFITSGIGFDETTVGKTVFLTREEAEAALSGGADG